MDTVAIGTSWLVRLTLSVSARLDWEILSQSIKVKEKLLILKVNQGPTHIETHGYTSTNIPVCVK